MHKAAMFYDYPAGDGDVWGDGRRDRIGELVDLFPTVITTANFEAHTDALRDVEVIFASWGMVHFEARHFAAMPNLKAVFYAAGNVRAFAQPLVDAGVILTSAWGVNAIPVAEMCLSQILLSLRGYFRTVRQYREQKIHAAKVFPRPGVNGETIGLIGLGRIGGLLRTMLKDYPVRVIAHDPMVSREQAEAMDVELVSLNEVFQRAAIVSNHIPDLPSTRGTLGREQFSAMRDGATFVQTGRGAQVIEDDLIAVMTARPDLTALLDVTMPEPPAADSPLWTLPNVIISPHIGGTIGDEVVRLGDHAIAMFEDWDAGRPLGDQVTAAVLETMG